MEEGAIKKGQGVDSSSLLVEVSRNCLWRLLSSHWPACGHMVMIYCVKEAGKKVCGAHLRTGTTLWKKERRDI